MHIAERSEAIGSNTSTFPCFSPAGKEMTAWAVLILTFMHVVHAFLFLRS